MIVVVCFFFFKQKTAYEMRISDWSSDVCSSDLRPEAPGRRGAAPHAAPAPLAAGRRRHDPEAHEAPPFARRGGGTLRRPAAAAPRYRVRRRPHRRLPDRDRGDVREFAAPRRRLRPHLPARLPLLGDPTSVV